MNSEDFNKMDDDEKKRKRNALQMQIVILESDNRKILSNKNILDAEMRKIKMDMERTTLTLDEKKRKFDRLAQDFSQNEEEIKGIKRQLNLISKEM